MCLSAIGLGVAGIGSVLSSKSQKKAAKTAANTSQQVAQDNNALAQWMYGQNQAALSPFMQRGNVAGDHMNALLGLGGAPANNNQPAVSNYYSGANPGAAPVGYIGTNALSPANFTNRGQYAAALQNGQYPLAQNWMGGGYVPTPQQQQEQAQMEAMYPNAPTSGTDTSPITQAANDAFEIFRNSTGYQSRLDEGMNALNSGWAGAGMIQSGAAMRDAVEYGQNFASNEFGNYMGYLGNQQGVGLAGASALAGVGQNYVNTVSNNNNNAGSAAANAALVRGQNNPFASVLGTIGGGILGGL